MAFLNNPDFGLLLMRVVLGGAMIAHGVPKFLAGKGRLQWVGEQMAHLGITFYPVFWGFMAALTEVVGGLFLVLGFLFRTSSALLAFTMVVAALYHFQAGSAFNLTGYPVSMLAVFVGLIFLGPGKFAVGR